MLDTKIQTLLIEKQEFVNIINEKGKKLKNMFNELLQESKSNQEFF